MFHFLFPQQNGKKCMYHTVLGSSYRDAHSFLKDGITIAISKFRLVTDAKIHTRNQGQYPEQIMVFKFTQTRWIDGKRPTGVSTYDKVKLRSGSFRWYCLAWYLYKSSKPEPTVLYQFSLTCQHKTITTIDRCKSKTTMIVTGENL